MNPSLLLHWTRAQAIPRMMLCAGSAPGNARQYPLDAPAMTPLSMKIELYRDLARFVMTQLRDAPCLMIASRS